MIEQCSNGYARGYARTGLSIDSPRLWRYQARYILANTRGWRGPIAREVKTELKKYLTI